MRLRRHGRRLHFRTLNLRSTSAPLSFQVPHSPTTKSSRGVPNNRADDEKETVLYLQPTQGSQCCMHQSLLNCPVFRARPSPLWCACHRFARDLNVALLLNIARAYSTQNDYTTSARACTAALTLNPCSAKALYLRGKALVAPASAGAFETDAAIR